MCRTKDYFIAVYDKEDNYITDFNSILECASYFNTDTTYISECLYKLKKLKNEFLLYKIDSHNDSLSKNEKERKTK